MIIQTFPKTNWFNFILNDTLNLRPLAPQITQCYTHKIAIVSWPLIMYCTAVASLPALGPWARHAQCAHWLRRPCLDRWRTWLATTRWATVSSWKTATSATTCSYTTWDWWRVQGPCCRQTATPQCVPSCRWPLGAFGTFRTPTPNACTLVFFITLLSQRQTFFIRKKVAAKINWHRYGMIIVRHCRPVYKSGSYSHIVG